MFTEEHI